MKFYGIILCNFYVFVSATKGYFHCPDNEIPKDCKTSCQPTCQTPYIPSCNSLICQPGCVCKPGTIRDEVSGKCINLQYCHRACSWNEVQNNGQNACERTCQNQHLGFHCVVQNRMCVCKPGLLRDLYSGKCVPYELCPQVQCEENQEWNVCTNPFSRKSCQNRFKKVTSHPSTCIPDCECKNGFIWDEYSKKCIPEYQCPKVCGENQVWRKCNDDAWMETCQRHKLKTNSKVCMAGCSCKDGYLWDEHYKKCVLREHCSKVCRENEEWCQSVPTNMATCQNILKSQCRKYYSKATFISHKSGCICREGFIWNELAEKCVVLQECPNIFPTTTTNRSTGDYGSTTLTESNTTEVLTSITTEATASITSTMNTLSSSISTVLNSATTITVPTSTPMSTIVTNNDITTVPSKTKSTSNTPTTPDAAGNITKHPTPNAESLKFNLL